MSIEEQIAEYERWQLDNMKRRKKMVNDKWLELKKQYRSYNDKVLASCSSPMRVACLSCLVGPFSRHVFH